MSGGTQADLNRLNLSQRDAKRSLWWIEGNLRLAGHKAVAKTLRRIGGLWWFLGAMMMIPPVSWISAICYRLVAANRHRLMRL